MDNARFGAFVARLRKERGLTQKELADRLNVTDKAVSKWETGKGFPDVKLLEPLTQELGVSLVELMQGKRQEADTLTVAEADAVVSQAILRSENDSARIRLQLLRRLMIFLCFLCLLWLWPSFSPVLAAWLDHFGLFHPFPDAESGFFLGAGGYILILNTSSPIHTPMDMLLLVGIPLLLLIVCAVAAVWARRREKKLK